MTRSFVKNIIVSWKSKKEQVIKIDSNKHNVKQLNKKLKSIKKKHCLAQITNSTKKSTFLTFDFWVAGPSLIWS